VEELKEYIGRKQINEGLKEEYQVISVKCIERKQINEELKEDYQVNTLPYRYTFNVMQIAHSKVTLEFKLSGFITKDYSTKEYHNWIKNNVIQLSF
jgi:hypothetical protein